MFYIFSDNIVGFESCVSMKLSWCSVQCPSVGPSGSNVETSLTNALSAGLGGADIVIQSREGFKLGEVSTQSYEFQSVNAGPLILIVSITLRARCRLHLDLCQHVPFAMHKLSGSDYLHGQSLM
jgi:hypothetical protein